MPRRAAPATALLAALAAAACVSERTRLDIPDMVIQQDSIVVPGLDYDARVIAKDPSGVIYVGARIYCGSIALDRDFVNPPRMDSVAVRFRFRVPASVPVGAQVILESQVIDDQNFSALRRDTLVARFDRTSPAPGAGAPCSLASSAR